MLGRKARTLALVLGEDVRSGAVNADKVRMLDADPILYPFECRFLELVAPSGGAEQRRAAVLRMCYTIWKTRLPERIIGPGLYNFTRLLCVYDETDGRSRRNDGRIVT
jgi:hypothetical protein